MVYLCKSRGKVITKEPFLYGIEGPRTWLVWRKEDDGNGSSCHRNERGRIKKGRNNANCNRMSNLNIMVVLNS